MGLAQGERDYSHDRKPRGSGYYDGSYQKPPHNNIPWGIIIAFIIGLIVGISSVSYHPESVINRSTGKYTDIPTLNTPQPLPLADLSLSEQPLPENGSYKLLYPPEHYVANFTVTADPFNNYVVKLVDSSQNPVLYLFVRANSTANVKAPIGAYELRWVLGKKWYGYDHLFGSSSTYQKALQAMDFYEEQTDNGKRIIGRFVKFNTLISGNLPSTRINSADF
ncbi:MAG: hypothetical protein ACLQDF_11230 [Desulfomonilia bacterium]